jgi:hypothetical protein
MPSSKGVTPYKYVTKNIYIAKNCKKQKKHFPRMEILAPKIEDLTMEQKNFHHEQK